jgi:hypothetical protein
MAKALSSFPKADRAKVARRRVAAKTLGLSYWAARDFLRKKERKGQDGASVCCRDDN